MKIIKKERVLKEIKSYYNLTNSPIQTQELYQRLNIILRKDKLVVLQHIGNLKRQGQISVPLLSHYEPALQSNGSVSEQ